MSKRQECRVAWCDRPVGDAWCCSRCGHRLERALGNVPAVVEQLHLALARLTRYGDGSQRPGRETPLPLDLRASAALGELRHTLVSWARLVGDERGHELPADNLPAISRWLLGHVEWLRHHEAGNEAVEQILAAVRDAGHVIDVPENRTTFAVGPCPVDTEAGPCPGEVRAYIPNDAEHTRPRLSCDACESTWYGEQWLRIGRLILERQALRCCA